MVRWRSMPAKAATYWYGIHGCSNMHFFKNAFDLLQCVCVCVCDRSWLSQMHPHVLLSLPNSPFFPFAEVIKTQHRPAQSTLTLTMLLRIQHSRQRYIGINITQNQGSLLALAPSPARSKAWRSATWRPRNGSRSVVGGRTISANLQSTLL